MAARPSSAASGDPPDPPIFGSFRPSQRMSFPLVVNRPFAGNFFTSVSGSASGKTEAPPPGSLPRPIAFKRSYADVVKPRVLKPSQDLHLFGNPKSPPGVKRFVRDGAPVVAINDAVSAALAAPFKWTLVGKFSHGVPSFFQFRKFFDKLKLIGSVNLHRLNQTQFMIILGEELDFVRVWLGKIWHVAGFPMRLFKWTPSFDSKVESSSVPVWVRLPGLPAHLFDRGVLFQIASSLGKPIRADSATALRAKFSEARFCVEVDLQLPRVDHIFLDIDGQCRKQRVVYENLPDFCSFCLHVGHSVGSCFKRFKELKPVLRSKMGEASNADDHLVVRSVVHGAVSGAADFRLANFRFWEMVNRFFKGDRGVPRSPSDLSYFKWLRGLQVELGGHAWVGDVGSGVGARALGFLQSLILGSSKTVEHEGCGSSLAVENFVSVNGDGVIVVDKFVFPRVFLPVAASLAEAESDVPRDAYVIDVVMQVEPGAVAAQEGDVVTVDMHAKLVHADDVAVQPNVDVDAAGSLVSSLVVNDVTNSLSVGCDVTSAGSGPVLVSGPFAPSGPISPVFKFSPLARPFNRPPNRLPLFLSQGHWSGYNPSAVVPYKKQVAIKGPRPSTVVHATSLQTIYPENNEYSGSDFFDDSSRDSEPGDEDEGFPDHYSSKDPYDRGLLSDSIFRGPVTRSRAALLDTQFDAQVQKEAREFKWVPSISVPDFEVVNMDLVSALAAMNNVIIPVEQEFDCLKDARKFALIKRGKSVSPTRRSSRKKKPAFF